MVRAALAIAILFLLLPFNFVVGNNDFIKKTYMVEMRDGIKLATDVYLPGDGKYPVILIRTPYDKNSTDTLLIKQILRNGYALVVQDMRGTHASQGKFMPFMDEGWGERQDGNDTISWILKQEWCNGKVAMWGGSAMGIAGYMAAGARDITCMMVAVATSNMYDAIYPGGEWRRDSEEWLKEEDAEYMIPLFEEHYLYDDFWRAMDLSTRYERVNTPIYHVGGWYDFFAEGTINTFIGLQWRDDQKLLMGPWTHGNFGTQQGDLTYPINSIFDIPHETFNWMNYWMKGEETGIMDEKVRFYMMGECRTDYGYIPSDTVGNEWWVSSEWQPYASHPTPFYLHERGLLNEEKPGNESPDFYYYDPSAPAPTIGGRNLVFESGPMRQNEVEKREDVLVYTTPPLEKPLAIAGNVEASLWINSTAKDTDFFIRLCDVYPDGTSIYVTDGVLMARHRKGFEREDFIDGECLLNISVGNTAIVFGAGHRIRVDITSSSYPSFERNPNTGDAIRKNESHIVAKNSIYHDALHPSCILLPVIDYINIAPENGIYIAGKKVMEWRNLISIGKIEFVVGYNCSGISFYFDGVKKCEDNAPPFSWICDEKAFGKHRLKVECWNDGEMVGREEEFFLLNI